MGYTRESWSVSIARSSHNSPQDNVDRELWDDMKRRLKEVIEDPQYAHMYPMDN